MPGDAAFYAYPSEPAKIGWTISAALKLRDKKHHPTAIIPWPKIPNVGLRLDEKVREEITASVCLIADITVPNFNVYYEIGFAVGRGKPIVPSLDVTIENAKQEVVTTRVARYGWVSRILQH
jgi:hypothetical protein